MLKSEGKIGDMLIDNLLNWGHSGFNVYCGNPLWPGNHKGLENLSRYIIRASFCQQRMTYIPGAHAKVIYRSKDGGTCKTFDALDWLAQLTCHILEPRRADGALLRLLQQQVTSAGGSEKKPAATRSCPQLPSPALLLPAARAGPH